MKNSQYRIRDTYIIEFIREVTEILHNDNNVGVEYLFL